MNDAALLLEQATSLLAEVARLDLAALSDEEVCALVAATEQAGRLLDTARVLGAAEIEDRSRYSLGRDGLARRMGHTRGAHLVESITRVSAAEVARRIRLGEQVRPRMAIDGERLPAAFPRVAEGMVAGALGVDVAANIIRCLTQAARHHASTERIDAAETALAAAAAIDTADLVAVHARVWREALDPDGALPRDEELRQRRAFHLGREVGGMTPFSGSADPVSAALLRAAFAEHSAPRIAPRFLDASALPDSECADDEGSVPVTDLADPRSREQKHFDIFFGLVTAGLRSTGTGPGEMRSLSTVMAVVKLSDLERSSGVAWLDDVCEPVSAATARELACDSGVEVVALADNGQVLYLGRKERFFSSAQKKALAVRDGGCVWINCTAPPTWCHAHHVLEYEHGGATDIDNGVLLCPAHHHELHASAFTMKMIDGVPRLLAPVWLDPAQIWRELGRSRVRMAA